MLAVLGASAKLIYIPLPAVFLFSAKKRDIRYYRIPGPYLRQTTINLNISYLDAPPLHFCKNSMMYRRFLSR